MGQAGPPFSRQDAKAQRIREFPLFAAFAALREIFPLVKWADQCLFPRRKTWSFQRVYSR